MSNDNPQTTAPKPRPPGPWAVGPWQNEWDEQLRDGWIAKDGRPAVSLSEFARRFGVSSKTVRTRAVAIGLMEWPLT